MDYKALIENAKICCGDTRVDFCTGVCINPSDKRGNEVRWCRQWLIKDLYTALEETLKRAEAAEAREEKAEKDLSDMRETWDMYGGEDGITAAFKKAEDCTRQLEELKKRYGGVLYSI